MDSITRILAVDEDARINRVIMVDGGDQLLIYSMTNELIIAKQSDNFFP